MKMLSFESRELVMHRFESVNDSSEVQAVSSSASSFYECKLIDNNVSRLLISCEKSKPKNLSDLEFGYPQNFLFLL